VNTTFETWSGEHKWEATSPRWQPGTTPSALHLEAQSGKGQWKGAQFRWRPPKSVAEDVWPSRPIWLKLTVGEGPSAGTATLRNAASSCMAAQVAEAVNSDSTFYRAPDHKRVAWLMVSDVVYAMANHRNARLLVAPARGPMLRLVAHAAILAQAMRPVRLALAEKGFLVASVGKADTDRARSAVYFAPGSEGSAKEIAAAVPGGATVEPLTWKEDSDIVVALGRSVSP